MNNTLKFQIGKAGLTEGVISSLNLALKTHRQIRIATLKSSGRDREKIKEIEQELLSKLEYNCAARIIGFTIILTRIGTNSKDIRR